MLGDALESFYATASNTVQDGYALSVLHALHGRESQLSAYGRLALRGSAWSSWSKFERAVLAYLI